MIYTVTFNPAIDYIAGVENLKINDINRTEFEKILAGGKGINVSIVLQNLGIESIALGFIAGFTGDEIKRQVESFNVKTDFVKIEKGFSRINVKLQSTGETAINGEGPKIPGEKIDELLNKILKLKEQDILVLAGSISRNIPDDIYEKICESLKDKNIKIVVDATGSLLVNVLKYHPFLIKPNKYELEEIFNDKITTNDDILIYAKKLQQMGARNVLVSMDSDGAIMVTNNGNHFISKAPKGTLVNSVGAGDSMVAGFLSGFLEYDDYEMAFKMGLATGSASAYSKDLATREEALKLFNEL